MLHAFLEGNKAALIARCHARWAARIAPRPLPGGMEHALPGLVDPLIDALRLEQPSGAAEGLRPLAAFGIAGLEVESRIGAVAATLGQELFLAGFTVDHVVHGHGDLAQSIVELAIERNEPILRHEFAVLGRCVDRATAHAINEFHRMRDLHLSCTDHRALGERLGLLTQDLRRHINTAMLCFIAIKEGGVGLQGATSAALERSLVALNDLMEHALRDARADTGAPARVDQVEVERFIAEARVAAGMEARSRGCELVVASVEHGLLVQADTQMLHSAVFGLLQNALEITRPRGQVRLKAYARAGRVLIDVEDEGGGLPESESKSPLPGFTSGASRSGPGDGLSTTRRAVEAMGGTLRFRDLPGIGCVSTIDLPRPGECAAEQTSTAERDMLST